MTQAKRADKMNKRMELSVFIFWQLWKVRNAWQFNKELWEPKLIINKAVREWN